MDFYVSSADAWNDALIQDKTFMLLFQMGSATSSAYWTGVKKALSGQYTNAESPLDLDPISISNSNKDLGIDQILATDATASDFKGQMLFS